MTKEYIYCDRCGNECEKTRLNPGFRLIKNPRFRLITNKDLKIDLCQKCYDELGEWMNKKGDNK